MSIDSPSKTGSGSLFNWVCAPFIWVFKGVSRFISLVFSCLTTDKTKEIAQNRFRNTDKTNLESLNKQRVPVVSIAAQNCNRILRWEELIEAVSNKKDPKRPVHKNEEGASIGVSVILDEEASQNFKGRLNRENNDLQAAGSSCTNRCFSFVNSMFTPGQLQNVLRAIAGGEIKVLSNWVEEIIVQGHKDFLALQPELKKFRENNGDQRGFELGSCRLGIGDLHFRNEDPRTKKNRIGGLVDGYYTHLSLLSYDSRASSYQAKRCVEDIGTGNNISELVNKNAYSLSRDMQAMICTSSQDMSYAVVTSKEASCSLIFDPHWNVLTLVPNGHLEMALTQLGWRDRGSSGVKKEKDLCEFDSSQVDIYGAKKISNSSYDFLGKPYVSENDVNLTDLVQVVTCIPSQS